MRITKAKFLENSSHPELTKAVLDQLDVPWSELCANISDYRDASAGVPNFIYYEETVEFAKKNLVLIMNALNELENDIGAPLKKPTDSETQFYNWLAWFALENCVGDLMRALEEQA